MWTGIFKLSPTPEGSASTPHNSVLDQPPLPLPRPVCKLIAGMSSHNKSVQDFFFFSTVTSWRTLRTGSTAQQYTHRHTHTSCSCNYSVKKEKKSKSWAFFSENAAPNLRIEFSFSHPQIQTSCPVECPTAVIGWPRRSQVITLTVDTEEKRRRWI